MRLAVLSVPFLAVLAVTSCSTKEKSETPAAAAEPSKPSASEAAAPAASGPRAVVRLKSGASMPGSIVASSKTDMVVAGDDGIEHKIPLSQVKAVEYGESPAEPEARAARAPAPVETPRAESTRTFELARGSEVSVRTNEAIDSKTAAEGQTFGAQVTREVRDANGVVVIPRGANARVVIKSASQGGRIKGRSDLVLDLQSVTIAGQRYALDTVDVTKQGKQGVGANRRTAEYTGGGAAVGAVIGAIAGGGKGAAIGAGAGAGAGALTQILTKGKSIKVPAESVLTFQLDRALKVTRRD